MSNREELKQLFREILDDNESLSLDSKEDKNTLLNVLTDWFWVGKFDDVVRIAETIFPNSQVDETMMSCELIIKTGLFNVAACGGEPVLVGSSSPEISPNE